MSEARFSEPTRQHFLGVVIYFLRAARRGLSILISFVVISTFNTKFIIPLIILFIVGGILMIVFSILQYQKFTFKVDEKYLIIHKGVLVKDKTKIPLERIQSVHIEEPLLQRLLGLASVQVDTAGSQGKELEVPALETEDAVALQKVLRAKKEEKSEELDNQDEARFEAVDESGSKPVEESRTLIHLNIPSLLKVGVTDNHLKNGFVALAIVFGYAMQLEEYFQGYVSGLIEENFDEIRRMAYGLLVVSIIAFLIVSILISLVKAIVKHYDFTARLESDQFYVKTGLLKREEYRIPLNKIQFMEWRTNPLRKLARMETAHIYQSQSQEAQRKQSVQIPGCYQRQTDEIMKEVFELEEGRNKTTITPHRRVYGLVLGTFISLPFVIGAIVTYFITDMAFFLELTGLIAFIVFFVWKYVNSVELTVDGELITIKKGWVFPKRIVIPAYKVQSVSVSQNIFQKNRNLSHFIIYTAAGDRKFPFTSFHKSAQLHNWLLYKAESSTRSWM
ncbi:PH domain-containing protein [Halocola ammonii]